MAQALLTQTQSGGTLQAVIRRYIFIGISLLMTGVAFGQNNNANSIISGEFDSPAPSQDERYKSLSQDRTGTVAISEPGGNESALPSVAPHRVAGVFLPTPSTPSIPFSNLPASYKTAGQNAAAPWARVTPGATS